MIDSIYQLLKTIINKELTGNATPAEFNLIAKQAQDYIFRGYFENENRDKNKENRGLVNQGYSNLSFIQRQRVDQFSVDTSLVFSSPVNPPPSYSLFTLPSNLYLIKDRGLSINDNVIDEAESSNFSFLTQSNSAPSTTFPVYEMFSASVRVYPNTITSVKCKYLRKPLDPKWTYTIVSSAELFNSAASDFQDFELHPSEFSNIVIEMLSYFGINIREPDVAKYAEALKRIVEVKEER